jgi:hypothetical protein
MPALFCVAAFLLCEAISLPRAEMGIGDDWSYIRTAQLLAQTGHVHYNGWSAPMLGWQLFAGAVLLKVFGYSFTVARLFTVLVAAAATFLMQRSFVRAGVGERNATIGTLAIVLTPLYMELSATFMTDVPGLFAVVICFYGCLRALEAEDSIRANGWLCFAALANALFGTCRQIAWLGVLVMVPSTLWLVRRQRKHVWVGSLATALGWAFVGLCMLWLKTQPYAIPESVFFKVHGPHEVAFMIKGIAGAVLETPFLILPVLAAYLVVFTDILRRFWKIMTICVGAYAAVLITAALRYGRIPNALLEPRLGDWVTPNSGYVVWFLGTSPPVVLHTPERLLLTAAAFISMLCSILFLWSIRKRILGSEGEQGDAERQAMPISWRQLGVLAGPFTAAYCALLIPRSSSHMMDRYLLPLLFVGGIYLVRAFQDFVRPSLPLITQALVFLTAVYSIGVTHDMFAYFRAREAAAAEVWAAGLEPNVLDGGPEYNHFIEILRYGHINDPKIINPANSYIRVGPYTGWSCEGDGDPGPGYEQTPHYLPRYGLSFEPNRCAGEGPFAPVSYFRWLGFGRTWLYIVKYQPSKVAG